MGCRTERERRLWVFAAAYTVLLYGSAYFVQFLLDLLLRSGWLRATVTATFVAAGGGLLLWLVRQRPGWREVTLFAAAALCYALLLSEMSILQERLHLLEYGVLGGLFYAAFGERWAAAAGSGRKLLGYRRYPAVAALLAVALAGWGDELWQGVLPNRYYDLRDVGFNALAGGLWIALVAGRRACRELDRPSGRQSRSVSEVAADR